MRSSCGFVLVVIENHCNLGTSGSSVSSPPTSNLNHIAVKLQSNWARRAEAPEGPRCDVPPQPAASTSPNADIRIAFVLLVGSSAAGSLSRSGGLYRYPKTTAASPGPERHLSAFTLQCKTESRGRLCAKRAPFDANKTMSAGCP